MAETSPGQALPDDGERTTRDGDGQSESDLGLPVKLQNDLNDIIRDQTYACFLNHVTTTGKGRRKDLPAIQRITPKLVLQFDLLRIETNSTYEQMTKWFNQIVKQLLPEEISKGRLYGKIRRMKEEIQKVADKDLNHYLDSQFSFSELPSILTELRLSREILLGNPKEYIVPDNAFISIEILISLNAFRNVESLPLSFLTKWIGRFYCSIPESKVRNKVESILKKIKKLKNSKSSELDTFMKQEIFEIHPELSNKTSATNNISVENSTKLHEKIRQLELEVKTYKSKSSNLSDQINDLKQTILLLKEDCKDKIETVNSLQGDLKEYSKLKKSNLELTKTLESVKASQLYKSNSSLRQTISKLKCNISSLQNEIISISNEKENLQSKCQLQKHKIKLEQTNVSKLRSKLTNEINKNKALHEILINDENDTQLKESNCNKFSDNVRFCYMALQGEANVSASNCSKVVQIVSNHLFGRNFSMKDLPSVSSALNFADESHFLAKQHVANELLTTEHFTLALDGTSRQKKHYVERHLVLSNKKVLSVGFAPVACDDARTLLEQAVTMFEELGEVFVSSSSEFSESKSVMKEILSKLKCLMSDRAANMKLFDKQMSEYVADLLDVEPSIHFLFCNAHFLLGLNSASEDAMKEVEDHITREQGVLGRDRDSSFRSFSSCTESSCYRLIRTATEILGPRGDEKNGCREEWLAFCDSRSVKSRFCSYRSNRFNNTFHNASALVFHKELIENFLENAVSHSNLKIRSVLLDLKDDHIMSLVRAMAIFCVCFTAPYWNLMNSHLPYGSFPHYVKIMDHALHEWHSEAKVPNTSIFPDFVLPINETAFLFSNGSFHESFFKAFQLIVEKSHIVLKRQLSDFLEGGVFGGDIPASVQQILDTCPLTNLTGERLFGDLDFDMSKRRHCSLHHRSTINMWKHNKTSTWLTRSTGLYRAKMFSLARKNGGRLRKQGRDIEKRVKQKIQLRMKENLVRKNDKLIKEKTQKSAILDTILIQGGPCQTKEELKKLYKEGTVEDLRVQIRYRKLFLGENLRLGGRARDLYETLLKSIESQQGN